jgi:hypothetical protein
MFTAKSAVNPGSIEATMDSRVIRIDEKGVFVGKVGIDVAEIRGCFEGELVAREQLVIRSTGRAVGEDPLRQDHDRGRRRVVGRRRRDRGCLTRCAVNRVRPARPACR